MSHRINNADYIGKVFGRLTVVERDEDDKNGYPMFVCACSCEPDRFTIVDINNLRSGGTKSCGCIQREVKHLFKHGYSKYPEYAIWKLMWRPKLRELQEPCAT